MSQEIKLEDQAGPSNLNSQRVQKEKPLSSSDGTSSISQKPTLKVEEFQATKFKKELEFLFIDHREELTTNKDLMVLNIDWPKYEILEQNGNLLSLVAHTGREIVGYSVNIVTNNLHYSDVIVCQNDVLYLTPKFRTGYNGIKPIKETERLAKLRGCHLVLWHSKQDTNLEKLLPRLKYRTQDIIFSKEL